jgi:hypothetical protein
MKFSKNNIKKDSKLPFVYKNIGREEITTQMMKKTTQGIAIVDIRSQKSEVYSFYKPISKTF